MGVARSHPLIRGEGSKCKEKPADKGCPKLVLDNYHCILGRRGRPRRR